MTRIEVAAAAGKAADFIQSLTGKDVHAGRTILALLHSLLDYQPVEEVDAHAERIE